MSKPLVFFGTEDFSAASLQALIDDGYTISAVVTKPDSYRGRNRAIAAPTVKTIAQKHGIKVLQPAKLAECLEELHSTTPACGVLSAYGKIVPSSIINLFEPGIVNVHPSLLPKYRGPSPVEAAILNGDNETGVSIMRLTAAMDAGPVYAQKRLGLHGNETRPELAKKLADEGARLLTSTLPGILDGSLAPTPQDDNKATYCPLLTKQMGVMKPNVFTAAGLERQVRAYLGFPKSTLQVAGQTIIVTKAKVTDGKTAKRLTITCRQNTFLEVIELIGPNGKTMSGQAFLHGYAKKSE